MAWERGLCQCESIWVTSVPSSHFISQSTCLYFTTEEVWICGSVCLCHILLSLILTLTFIANTFGRKCRPSSALIILAPSGSYNLTHTHNDRCLCRSLSRLANLSITSLHFMCAVGEQQFLIPNLILQLGMHDISAPYLVISVCLCWICKYACSFFLFLNFFSRIFTC